MEGFDQIINLLFSSIDEPFEEYFVERGHVIPADYVVNPFVIDLACLDCLYEGLIELDILGNLRIFKRDVFYLGKVRAVETFY
jgi:hypothetical protein